MNDLLNSKLVKDLKEGKLPAVVIDNASIAKLSGSFLLVLLIVILVYRITGK